MSDKNPDIFPNIQPQKHSKSKPQRKLTPAEVKERIDILKKHKLFAQHTDEEIANSMVRVAFDYDGTLSETDFFGNKNANCQDVREFFLKLKERGVSVCIMTRRFSEKHEEGRQNEHQIVYKVADELGLSHDDVHFTNREWKVDMIHDLGIHLLIDDDAEDCVRVRQRFSIYNAVCLDKEANNGVLWQRGAESMIRFYLHIFIDKEKKDEEKK